MHDSVLIAAEFLLLILKILYYICEGTYRLLVPIKKKSVAGEVVLITGAGHGIGKELAIGYASLGATVVCWDINKEINEQTANEIKNMEGTSVYAYQCDVADREQVFKVAEKVKKEIGDVTILINNAGIACFRKFQDFSINEIEEVIDVNIMGHYWVSDIYDKGRNEDTKGKKKREEGENENERREEKRKRGKGERKF